MAIDCSVSNLSENSSSLAASLSTNQLLAALVYIQCTSNGMDCDAQSLKNASKCLWGCMSEAQLIAALVYIQCVGGGGGSVEACLVAQSGAPVTPCAFTFGLAYDNDSTSPTAGSFWFWDATGAAWVRFSV